MDVGVHRAFAQRGSVVVPKVVSPALLQVANRAIDRLLAEAAPPRDHRGNHFYWPRLQSGDPFLKVLLESDAFAAAQSLIAPGKLEVPSQAQVSLIFPPFHHRPAGPHIDGTTPPEPNGRPGTFTMLAGIMLSDQPAEDMGNLWVWPGTHLTSGAYFRERGIDALMTTNGSYPPVKLPPPRQVLAKAGDLLLAHYMLGHNIGGNNSSFVRRALYFRLMREGHRTRWRECLCDPMLEFDAVRAAMGAPGDCADTRR
jgi:hypothetical protein